MTADRKISQLPVASSVGTSDILPIVQSGATKQISVGGLLPGAVHVKWYGAAGTAATDKSAFKSACAAAMSLGVPLFVTESLDLSTWGSSDTVAVTADLAIHAMPGVTITGPGKGVSGAEFFSVTNASLSIEGRGVWDGFKYLAKYPDGNTSSSLGLNLIHADFRNYSSVIIANTTQTGTVGTFKDIRIKGCRFSARHSGGSNGVDINIYKLKIAVAHVTDNICRDGGEEGFRLTPDAATLPSTDFYFINNHFENYLNEVSGSDNDSHFIRCEGTYAEIVGNTFKGLYVGVGYNTLDTEGIRPTCDNVLIQGNKFIDAGIQEGMCTLKGCEWAEVFDNDFAVTAGYKTYNAAHTASLGSIGILMAVAGKQWIERNRFYNFDNIPIECEGGTSDNIFTRIAGNGFIDCDANKASADSYIRYAHGGVLELFDNWSETTNSGTPVIPPVAVTLSTIDTGARVICRNNRWRSSDTHYLIGTNGGTNAVDIQGDSFTGGDHIIRQGSSGAIFSHFVIKNVTLETDFLKPIDMDGCTFKRREIDISGQSQTTGATQGVCVTMPVANGDAVSVHFVCVGRQSDGSNHAKYVKSGLYGAAADTAAIIGALDIDSDNETAAWTNADTTPTSNLLRCRTGGVAATTIDWSWRVQMMGYTP